jgi:hypothetical protein
VGTPWRDTEDITNLSEQRPRAEDGRDVHQRRAVADRHVDVERAHPLREVDAGAAERGALRCAAGANAL